MRLIRPINLKYYRFLLKRKLHRLYFPRLSKRGVLLLLIFLITQISLIVFVLFQAGSAKAAPWASTMGSYTQRKQLTLVNNSGATIHSTTTYTITIDTKTLYDAGKIQSDCDDLRILYQPSDTSTTELARAIDTGTLTCATSTAAKISFPLQADISNGSSSNYYYMYYLNPDASAPSATQLSAYNVGAKTATFVAPFNSTTTALAAGTATPSTETGAIRYSGSKNALSFDGINDNVLYSSSVPSSTAFTVEQYVKFNSIASGGGVSGDGASNWAIYFTSSGILKFFFDFATSTSCNSDTPVVTGQWYHIAATGDGTTLRGFIDGTKVCETSLSSLIAFNATYVGAKGYGGTTYHNGLIDEFRISNIARYTANFTAPTAPFVRDEYAKLLYHFDENGDDPRNSGKAIDDSGNAKHGTITGAKYVAGLVGVDSSSTDTGNLNNQSYAGHNGIFIEEATTNKITNPSFDHTTYNTNWDAIGANLTASENTTAPYYKFGSKSLKLIASASAIDGTSNMDTIGIDPDSTATHTLSFYAYDATSGNVGGTVSSSIVKPIWEGTAQAGGTYTDMGGGWWRVTYATTTTDSANEYGVEVQVSKTVYIDGVQLEAKSYATTYADGTLGTGYAWTSTAHESTSTRTAEVLDYATANNLTYTSTFTISMWVKLADGDPTVNWRTFLGPAPAKRGPLIMVSTVTNGSCINQRKFNLSDNAGNAASSCATVSLGSWYHIVGTWDGTTSKIYVNNSLGSATSNTFRTDAYSDFGLGYNKPDPTARTSDSTLSDVRLYSSALTAAEVGDMYYAGLGSHSEQLIATEQFTDGQPPVLAWKFNEGTGSTAYDSTTSLDNGTISGATYSDQTPWTQGFSLKFDGTDDKVSRAYSSDTELDVGTNDFSVSSWFKHPSTVSGTDILISRYNTAGYKVYMNSSGYVCFDIDFDSTWSPADTACTTTSYADSKWHFIEGVKTSTSITLYIDGKQVAQDASISASTQLSGGNPTFYVGIDSDGSSNPWDGFIDEVRVFNSQRSAAQVKAEYTSRGSVKGVAATFGPNDPNSSLNTGLAGYWKMDEASWDGTSNEVVDASGNGKHGTAACTGDGCTKPTTATAKFANGGNFDGTDDYINAGSNLLGSTYTISAWFKGNSYSAASDNAIFSQYNGSAGRFIFGVRNTSSVYNIEVFDGGGAGTVKGTTSLSTGTWYHGVVVNNNKSVQVFLNGNQEFSTTFSNNAPNTTNYIASYNPSGTGWFNGSIDDVRVYNRALSNAEVRQLYEWAPGPVGYWKMDEKTGTNATDSSGNSNDLTLTNSPSWTTGKYGSGVAFTGSNAHLLKADDPDFDFADDAGLTLETWFKHTTASAQEIILSKFNEAGYKIIMESDGDITCALDYDDTWSPTDSITSTAATYDDNLWHHIACVKSGATSLTLYIDGVAIGSDSSLTATNTLTNSDPLYLGINADGTSDDFIGQLDDAKIYNYARSAKQIISDINAGHPAVGSPVGSAIAHWKFDEGNNTVANNSGSAGSLLNGSLQNMASPATATSGWTNSGKLGKALNYDGSDDYVDTADVSAIELTDATFSFWGKVNNTTQDHDLITKGAHTTGVPLIIWFDDVVGPADKGTGNTNTISVLTYDGSTQHWVAAPTNTINDTNWHHIVIVINPTNSQIKIYVDGKLVEQNTKSWNGIQNTATAVRFGNANPSAVPLLGLLDEVKIYNYALSEDEVKLDYNQGKATVLGAVSTDASGNASWSSDRSYCPPGDTTASCAPVAEWGFEEGVDGTCSGGVNDVCDRSGNANDGAWNGTGSHWTQGKIGKAGKFNGTDDYVSKPDTTSLSLTGSFTLSAWIKPMSSSQTADAGIIVKDNAGSGVRSFYLNLHTSTNLRTMVSSDGTSATAYRDAASNLVVGNWSFVTSVYNATTQTLHLYINGVLNDGPISGTVPNSIFDGNADTTLGYEPRFSSYFNGLIDQVRVYNYARTAAQIAWDYNQGAPVAHWKLDECTGATVHSSNETYDTNLNGTITIGGTGTQDAVGTCISGDTGDAWYNGRTGKYNASLNFDGTDDYASTANVALITANSQTYSNISWGAWVNAASNQTSKTILHKSSEFELYTDASGYATCQVGGTGNTAATSAVLTNSTWSHLLCTYDGTNIKLYINGLLTNSNSRTGTITSSNATNVNIAQKSDTTGRYAGQIDDVSVYHYSLTAQQVKSVYNQGAVIRYAPISGTL